MKDKIVFENELLNNGIKYYTEINEQPLTESGFRYFLLNEDRKKIDDIIKKNGISTSLESSLIIDFEDNNKLMRAYLLVAVTIVGILLVLFALGILTE